MSIFDPVATYTTSTPQDEFAAALNEPYVAKDILDDPNLRFFTEGWMHGLTGTGIRDLTLPPLNPIAANRYERPEDFAARRAAAEAANPSLTPDQYKASPSYREQIPWEQGMTEDRAAAKAAQFDQSYLTQQLAEKKPLESFFMSLASGLFDPTNFVVPYLGSGMGAAAAARFGWGTFGKVAAEGAVAAGNNALASGVFAALTASTRQKLGEDVSFNAIINEIAMSAIIGGAFGTGIHLVGGLRNRALMKRAADALETIDTTSKARAISEIAADMLARRGEVELPPAAIETVKTIKDRVEEITAPERDAAVATEVAKLPDQPGMEVVTPSGLTIRAVPEVVDLRTLNQASGDMQIRDRSRFSSDAWVMGNAGKLDGNRLLPDRNAGLGAPVVGQDGTINSGNGRVKLIMQAANAHPEAYAAYLNTLREKGYVIPEAKNGEVYGLVMRQATDMTPDGQAAWNTDANAPLVARMSASEIAMMDSRALTDETLALLRPGELTSAGNAEFLRRFTDNLPELERGVMRTADGSLSKDGATRIENAIVAAAYGKADPGVVRRFAETEDENARAVIGAMADVAPKWAGMVRAVIRGELDPASDVTTELTQALKLVTLWRDQAAQQRRPTSAVIREKMNQVDMFDGDIKPMVKVFVKLFYRDDHFATAMGREALSNALSRLVDDLMSAGRPSLFADPKFLATPLEIVTHVADTRLGNVPTNARDLGYAASDGPPADNGQGNRGGPSEGGQAPGKRFVGGISTQQSLETQGVEYVPSDKDMSKVEGELIYSAKKGGKANVKAMSTEGRYGGVERSIDLEVSAGPEFNVDPLWLRMVDVGARYNQDAVFLAKEVAGPEVDPLRHRPGYEITFDEPKVGEALDAEIAKLKEQGIEYFTISVGGKPKKAGAMAPATGIRVFYMPEFERRWGFAETDLASLDDEALTTHMQAKADEYLNTVSEISAKVPGLKGRVAWFDADVAFRERYQEVLRNGTDQQAGLAEGASRPAGVEVWRGQSVREGLAGADRQREFTGADAADSGGDNASLPDKIAEGDKLPFALDRYFTRPEGFVDVPLSQVDNIRARPDGIKNAAKYMRMAYNGEGGIREPVSLRLENNGRYTVLDGNSTYANAVENGWPAIRGELFTTEQFAAKEAAKEQKKLDEQRQRVADLMPTIGKVTREEDIPVKDRPAFKVAFVKLQPERTFDELYRPDVLPARQKELLAFDREMRAEYGLPREKNSRGEERDAPLKVRVDAEQKMPRKNYTSTSQLTDLVRTGFTVPSPDIADKIVEAMSKRWRVWDGGWEINDAGYFDRKALIIMDDGTIAEVQFWNPELHHAKTQLGGHSLYKQERKIDTPLDVRLKLKKQMNDLYRGTLEAIKGRDPRWADVVKKLQSDLEAMDARSAAMLAANEAARSAAEGASVGGSPADLSTSANISKNASSETRLPESMTSMGKQGVQEDAPVATDQAPLTSSTTTAGRPSQSKNLSIAQDIGTLPDVVDPAAAPKEEISPEIEEAKARLGKAETPADIAELVGIDPKTGDFPEMKDIEQIKFEGRLTEDDQAVLDQAKANYDNAVAYGKALEAAVACVK